MPWTIEVEKGDHVVRVVSDGPMRLVTIRQVSAEAIAAATLDGTRKFLADDRHMLPQLSTQKKSDFEFFEDVALNRGFVVQLFTDPEKARAWLNAP